LKGKISHRGKALVKIREFLLSLTWLNIFSTIKSPICMNLIQY
jgi:hypothetical protein